MRSPAIALVLTGAVAVLLGCGDSEPAEPVTVTQTVEQTESEAPPAGETETNEAETAAETTASSPEIVKPVTLFSAPSGNIGCAIDKDYARCDIAQKDWEPPTPPASCPDLEYGDALEVSGDSKGDFACHGDTTRGSDDVLEYGDSIQATESGIVVCSSASDGMTCENTQTGHGFFIARQSYRVF